MTDQPKHSRFGGSSASRWMACPGSVVLCDQMPKQETSVWAAEGTLAHTLAEHCLTNGERTTAQFVGMTLEMAVDSPQFTKEMCDAVQVYLDAVYEEADKPGAELYVEEKFTLDVPSADKGEVFGRNDAMVYDRAARKLTVFDYKHGAGVPVSATENKQALFYATGALLAKPDWPIGTVEVVIVQPRAFDPEGGDGVKRWEFDALRVLDFAAEVDDAISLAKETTAGLSLKEGSHCRWCAAEPICPAKRNKLASAFGQSNLEDVTVTNLPDPNSLDGDRLARILEALDALDGYKAKVVEYAMAKAMGGVRVPGWKVVDKVGRRKWVDDDSSIAGYIASKYGVPMAEVMPPKLVTITEAERLITAKVGKASAKEAKDDVSVKFTVKESSGVTLVRDSDKRDPVTPGSAFSSSVTL